MGIKGKKNRRTGKFRKSVKENKICKNSDELSSQVMRKCIKPTLNPKLKYPLHWKTTLNSIHGYDEL